MTANTLSPIASNTVIDISSRLSSLLSANATRPPPTDNADSEIFGKSLLERAGLEQRHFSRLSAQQPGETVRYDITKDDPGQLRFRNNPL